MSFDWPQFVLKGSTPYKVIGIDSGGFLAVDMIDGDVDRLYPPTHHDEYVDDRIWVGFHEPCTNNFTSYHRHHGEKHTFYFDTNYQLHRDDGPAQIIDDGVSIRKVFWIHGVQYPNPEDWFEALPDKKKAAFNLDEIQ